MLIFCFFHLLHIVFNFCLLREKKGGFPHVSSAVFSVDTKTLWKASFLLATILSRPASLSLGWGAACVLVVSRLAHPWRGPETATQPTFRSQAHTHICLYFCLCEDPHWHTCVPRYPSWLQTLTWSHPSLSSSPLEVWKSPRSSQGRRLYIPQL